MAFLQSVWHHKGTNELILKQYQISRTCKSCSKKCPDQGSAVALGLLSVVRRVSGWSYQRGDMEIVHTCSFLGRGRGTQLAMCRWRTTRSIQVLPFLPCAACCAQAIVNVARLMRHDGLRLAVSTQSPSALAPGESVEPGFVLLYPSAILFSLLATSRPD